MVGHRPLPVVTIVLYNYCSSVCMMVVTINQLLLSQPLPLNVYFLLRTYDCKTKAYASSLEMAGVKNQLLY